MSEALGGGVGGMKKYMINTSHMKFSELMKIWENVK